MLADRDRNKSSDLRNKTLSIYNILYIIWLEFARCSLHPWEKKKTHLPAT